MIKTERFFAFLFDEGLDPEMAEEETEILFACPLCEDDRPRFYIAADAGMWTCFHCGERGSFYQFFTRVLGQTTHQAMESVRAYSSRDDYLDPFEADYLALPGRKEESPTFVELPEEFHTFEEPGTPARFLRYLDRRHVSRELAISREVGYAVTGHYADRIILPVRSDGLLYALIARSIFSSCPGCGNSFEDCECEYTFRKVLYPKGSKPRATLYNLDAVRGSLSPRLVVTEGAFDALRLPNEAVALLGSTISDTQVSLLAGISRGRDVVVCLDGDASGRKGAVKVADALTSMLIRCKIATVPDGTDPGNLNQEDLTECLKTAKPYVL